MGLSISLTPPPTPGTCTAATSLTWTLLRFMKSVTRRPCAWRGSAGGAEAEGRADGHFGGEAREKVGVGNMYPYTVRHYTCMFYPLSLSFSASPSVMDSEPSPPSTSSPSVSRSCDLQPHRPITLEDSQPIARRLPMGGEEEEGEGGEVVVDEEAIQQSVELNQRLRLETLSEFTFSFSFT